MKPDKARAVEDMILRFAQSGQLANKMSEQNLITLLEQVNEQQSKPKITVGNKQNRKVIND